LDTQFKDNRRGPNDKKYYTDTLNEGNFWKKNWYLLFE
jgi:hypothetical protein